MPADSPTVTVLAPDWVPLAEAIAQSGRSQRFFERAYKAGTIRAQLQKVPGRKAMRVIHAADVARLVREQTPALVAQPKAKAAAPRPAALLPAESLAPLLAALQELVAKPSTPPPLWLTWKQASDFSGIPPTALKQLCEAGTIELRRFGRSPRIKRASLEAYAQ